MMKASPGFLKCNYEELFGIVVEPALAGLELAVDGGGNIGLLGGGEWDGALDGAGNLTGIGLHDAGVDGGDIVDQVQAVVLGHGAEEVDGGLGQTGGTGDVAQGGHLVVGGDEGIGKVVGDLLVLENGREHS